MQDKKQMGSQDARQKKGEMRHKTKQIGRQDARQKNGVTRRESKKKWGDETQDIKKLGDETRDKMDR